MHTMLCMPVPTSSGGVLGVLQLANKRDGDPDSPFTEDDVQLVRAIAALTSVTVENSYQFERTQAACAQMGDLASFLADSTDVPYVCQKIARTAAGIMHAEHAVLVTFDDTARTMSAYSGAHRDWVFSTPQAGADATVVGQCASRGEVVRRTLPRSQSNWKSFTSTDMKNALGVAVPFSVTNLLAVPLMAVDSVGTHGGQVTQWDRLPRDRDQTKTDHASTCQAVLVLFNKLNDAEFNTLDDDFVVILSSQAIAILQNALRSQVRAQEQARVYELLRSTTDILGRQTSDGVHGGLARVLASQLAIEETLLFIEEEDTGDFVARKIPSPGLPPVEVRVAATETDTLVLQAVTTGRGMEVHADVDQATGGGGGGDGGCLLILPLHDTLTRAVTGVIMMRRDDKGFDDIGPALREAVQRQAVAAMMVARNVARAASATCVAHAIGKGSWHSARFVLDGATGHLVKSTTPLNGAFSPTYQNLVVHGTVVTLRLSDASPTAMLKHSYNEWLGSSNKAMLCLKHAIDVAKQRRIPMSVLDYDLASDSATVNGKPWLQGNVLRKASAEGKALAASKAMRVAHSARTLLELRGAEPPNSPRRSRQRHMSPSHRRGASGAGAGFGAGGGESMNAGSLTVSTAAHNKAGRHTSANTTPRAQQRDEHKETKRDSSRRRFFRALSTMLVKDAAAGSTEGGQLNTKLLCSALERHVSHGSPKLELGLLQELMAEFGFPLNHHDMAMVQRQLDSKNSGWVTYRDFVRFMTPGYAAVHRLNAYILPVLDSDGITVSSITVFIEPLF